MQIGMVKADVRQDMVALALEKRGMPVEWITDKTSIIPDVVILGMPVSVDGVHLYKSDIKLSEFMQKCIGKTVLGGRVTKPVYDIAMRYGVMIRDYFEREEMTVRNVIPTVEGALQIAMEQTDVTLHGCKVLICGYGRIGKLLAARLQALGAIVTVCARNPKDFAWCDAYGLIWSDYSDFKEKCRQNTVVFNTVPQILLDRSILSEMTEEQLIIDVASAPGGVDQTALREGGVRFVHATALPAKVAPKTAGEIICETILTMLKEENTLA